MAKDVRQGGSNAPVWLLKIESPRLHEGEVNRDFETGNHPSFQTFISKPVALKLVEV